ncbi:helix-turn-helix transcriptional regulator [Propionispora vibrioides]|uniref:Predicted DNA-binding transcriptional regulator YafY, contains an HTH and WYL domains n=1 Tax=Propionispora vibrioides TaxID=112903 RepID=A0A1H8RBF2_9FIRM|nr:YafY family protein [Propionispora vibrioides]SEO63474.1 Predicted DNA-binding transcriptional regulator YafY, contains an HTH and WYL domains [Propionispora vibrioides]
MKMNRLFEITIILLNKGTATAKELAERFGVSTRTIYRDIDVLSGTGVPVYMSKGSGGGIYLMENYSINRTFISTQESESLLLAIRTLQATKYPEVDKVLEKLGAIFKDLPSQDWVEVDFSPWGSTTNESDKFNDIKRALLQRRVVYFRYVNAEGQKSNRYVEPEKLVFKDNAWYLTAFCRQRQEFRTFRISRMKELMVLPDLFERKAAYITAKETKDSSQPSVHLKVRVWAKALNRLYDYFDDTYITANGDGSFTLAVDLPGGEWLYSYILSLGDSAEVLEPLSLRRGIVSRMKQALNMYEVN